jgi:hypothetical protein
MLCLRAAQYLKVAPILIAHLMIASFHELLGWIIAPTPELPGGNLEKKVNLVWKYQT